jgi:hypothetical protein
MTPTLNQIGGHGDGEIERYGDKKRETLSKGDGGIKRWGEP